MSSETTLMTFSVNSLDDELRIVSYEPGSASEG